MILLLSLYNNTQSKLSKLTMESPFYGYYRSPSYASEIPTQPIHQNPTRIKPAAKVVQIPVHFVGSDPNRSTSVMKIQKPEPDRSASALRIQKVFRGFLVRKSLKKIISIRKEVDEIERKLLRSETAELIRRDEREKLRVNETLMSLLLKLDSIRGFDSGVRDCRRGVIKRAIALQEKVDSIALNDTSGNHEENGKSSDLSEVSDVVEQSANAENQIAAEEENPHCDSDSQEIPDSTGNQEENRKSTNQSEVTDLSEHVEAENQVEQICATNDEKTQVKEELECPECDMIEEIDEENEAEVYNGKEESKRNRELLEKMVEENEKMMRLMNELCQRNEVQTRMLNSLGQRVEQLEKAFICDRLKNKKKKRHPAP